MNAVAIANALKDQKSPVNWSSASSLAIPEPRCAVVNFSGLAAMPTSKTADTPAVLEFWDMQGNYFKKNILCSAQGSSSLAYPKKNVKVDLLNEDGSEFDLKIGNWVAQDGFHLKSYYTDFFRGVGVTSYKFWDEIMRFNGLDKDRPYKRVMINASEILTSGTSLNNPDDMTLQLDTGALCHPDGFPCIVYLNGTFYGIFSWQIKKQRKNYRMDKSTVEHIHLDGTLYTQYFWNGVINWTTFEIRNPNKLYTMDGKKYDGDSPKELIDETSEKYNPDNKDHVRSAKVKKYIQDLVHRFGELKALYSEYSSKKSDEVLLAAKDIYSEIFDRDNMRDYLIFSDIIDNSDGIGHNCQWTTYDGVKWYVNAYDLDMSFGGDWQGRYITAPIANHIYMHTLWGNLGTSCPIYYANALYRTELEARYKALRDTGIIDVEHIVSKLEDWTARIGQGNYVLEYERWPDSPCLVNYNDSVDRVRKWLTIEIANMDRVYNYKSTTIEAVAETLNKTLNNALSAEAASRRSSDIEEAHERSIDDVALRRQIDKLALLALQNEFRAVDFKKQIAELREYFNEIYQAVADTENLTYMGAGVASTNQVSKMLSDVMSGTDDGEITSAEIPEALQGRVAASSEVGDMLVEIFSNNN